MADQSDITRRRRLKEGRCPVHGLPMAQIGIDHGKGKPIVACPRTGCTEHHVVDWPDDGGKS